jgi:tetratricopeptide (TPR) repeat protein
MSDPLRTDFSRTLEAASAAGRDAKIEQLLLAGLDRYFAAQYEQAINVWTRVLFLDRNHARARAYIERARSALAERQRESEELLQSGLAAFGRGDGDEARRLLQAAVNHGAPADEALAVLDRLNRLERGAASQGPMSRAREGRSPLRPRPPDPAPWRRAGLVLGLALIALCATGSLFVAVRHPFDWRSLLTIEPAPPPSTPLATTGDTHLPVPLNGETALARARALNGGGHLRDALAELDRVRPTDAQRADADRLRADIQRQLIGLVSAAAEGPPDSRQGGGPLP